MDHPREQTAPAATGAPHATIAAALQRERRRVGLSLAEVARRAGIAKSTLSQLESASGNPSIETLWALGVALGVPFSRLVEPPVPSVHLVRAGEGRAVFSDQAPYLVSLLSSGRPGAVRDLYAITADPGPARVSEPHQPGVVEHLVLSSGRALVGPVDQAVELGPGDYLSYPGDAPHLFQAMVADTHAILLSDHV